METNLTEDPLVTVSTKCIDDLQDAGLNLALAQRDLTIEREKVGALNRELAALRRQIVSSKEIAFMETLNKLNAAVNRIHPLYCVMHATSPTIIISLARAFPDGDIKVGPVDVTIGFKSKFLPHPYGAFVRGTGGTEFCVMPMYNGKAYITAPTKDMQAKLTKIADIIEKVTTIKQTLHFRIVNDPLSVMLAPKPKPSPNPRGREVTITEQEYEKMRSQINIINSKISSGESGSITERVIIPTALAIVSPQSGPATQHSNPSTEM